MFDQQVTIYNYHKAGQTESWNKTVLSGVAYRYVTEKTVASSGAIVMTPMLYITIPVEADTQGKSYVDYVSYQGLSAEQAAAHWTINPKCNQEVMVCGACDAEVTAEYKISTLKKDYMKSGLVCGLEDNTEEELLKHYRVVCR